MTYTQVDKALAPYGVQLVRGTGYFYFADTGEAFIAHLIPSVYATRLHDLTLAEWVAHVESAIGFTQACEASRQ